MPLGVELTLGIEIVTGIIFPLMLAAIFFLGLRRAKVELDKSIATVPNGPWESKLRKRDIKENKFMVAFNKVGIMIFLTLSASVSFYLIVRNSLIDLILK